MPLRLPSGSDTLQGLILDRGVDELANTFSCFDHLAERSYEVGNIGHGVIISTTASKSEGGGVIFQSDVLDCGAVGDSEVHCEIRNQSVRFGCL